MPDITAQLNNLRIAPRKARALTRIVKGLDIEKAKANLLYTSRRPSFPLIKLIDSAAANAANNFGLEKDSLYIKEIIVNEGVKLKRFMPKAMGMVNPIQKKTSRIKIVLDKMPEEKIKQMRTEKSRLRETYPPLSSERLRKSAPASPPPSEDKEADLSKKPEIKKEFAKGAPRSKAELATGQAKKPKFGGIKSIGRKFFRRKSIG